MPVDNDNTLLFFGLYYMSKQLWVSHLVRPNFFDVGYASGPSAYRSDTFPNSIYLDLTTC
jgi:hypothetical protein